ncbi:MAG: 16S rRNA (guanine(527)-N(7))-methyltransferase RsmG [Bacteroidales bacterium]|nr:16S rRNA (guanine(527)-N(7))-methyltransferase RsmG [Bacteroidales bacterium]
MDIINKYFPNLSDTQKQQFSRLGELYADWNTKINVISRKDIENIYERHILHSLGIAKIISFKDHSSVLDVGTGGGFPGIPLAILFPNVKFHLIDSIGKKIQVATEVAAAIGLKNISFCHERAEQEKALYDFVISRAVMRLDSLIKIVRKNISPEQRNALPNGIICLKGGDLDEEIKSFNNLTTVFNLSDIFEEEFFETKKVVHVVINKSKK